MTSHDLAVSDASRGRQAFGEGISHHFVRAQRHKFEETIQYEFTHIVLKNANITAELSAYRIFLLIALQARMSSVLAQSASTQPHKTLRFS